MRNGIAKPSKSQALNKEQKIKRCRSENSAPLFYSPKKSVGAVKNRPYNSHIKPIREYQSVAIIIPHFSLLVPH